MALGGAAGALARYGLGGWIHGLTGAAFPWGTMTVNVVGCFALGLVTPLLLAPSAAPEARAFVAVGLLGGFTTFSTFSFEAMALAQNGHWQRAAVYTIGSVVLGLLAVVVGFWIGTSLVSTRS